MSSKEQNIEKLFQDAFDQFEPNVSPEVWSKVQSQIGSAPSPASDGGASSSGSSLVSGMSAGIAKIAAVVGIAGALVAGGYYLISDDASQNTVAEQPAVITGETDSDETVVPEQETMEITTSGNEPVISNAKETSSPTNENSNTAVPQEPVAQQEVNSPAENPAQTSPANAVDNPSPVKQEGNTTKKADPKAPAAGVSTPAVEDKPAHQPVKPMAFINASVKKGKLPLQVRFYNQDAAAENVTWDFGDGSALSSSPSTYHTFEKVGVYSVILTVLGEQDWISRDTVQIMVSPNYSIIIPEYFTPNGDGIHDAFHIETQNIEKFQCIIKDRAGNTIYEMNDINSFWDGRDRMGNQVSVGAYFYFVTFTTEDGYTDGTKGIVSLQR